MISCLKALCERYKSRGGETRSGEFWNVFAVDLNNEPHGRAAWGTGCPLTDWRLGAERLGSAVLSVDPTLLVFCEGTSGNAAPTQCPEPCFWGGGLCSAVEAPVRLPIRRRLVLSPHVYGPLVFMQVRDKRRGREGDWKEEKGRGREGREGKGGVLRDNLNIWTRPS